MDGRMVLTRRGWALIGIGVLLVALGGFPLLDPAPTPEALAVFVPVALLLAAASQFVAARRLRSPRVVAGTVWLVAASAAYNWPAPTANGLAWLVGVALLAGGVVELVMFVRLPRASNLQFVAAAGALTHLLFGATVLVWPSISPFTLSAAVSIWLLLFGTRIVIHGIDRLRHRDAPDQIATGRWSPKLRIAGSVTMLLVAALAVGAAVVIDSDTTPEPGAFYAAPRELDATPGTLLRRQVIEPFVDGATTYRVLYTSRDLDGTPAAASGLVIVPDDGEVPDGGRPILAFTHGTIGVARSCAPSLLEGGYVEQMWGLEAFLDAGWIVTAPDYLGLGSEGDHPYLVGQVAAEGTLDAVRAAIGLAGDDASSRFAVAGHSQGGHAALFAGEQAAAYAPELDLVAVAGLAPASELASFIEANDGTTFGNLLGAYAVVAWDRAFDDIDATDIVDPAVLPIVERLADACVATGPEAIGLLTDAELLQLGFLVSPIWQTEPWASRIIENTPGNQPIDAPLLIVQGTDDVLIRADIQRDFVARLCDNDQQLEYREFTDVGHLGIDDTASDYVVDWLTDRLTTPLTIGTCGRAAPLSGATSVEDARVTFREDEMAPVVGAQGRLWRPVPSPLLSCTAFRSLGPRMDRLTLLLPARREASQPCAPGRLARGDDGAVLRREDRAHLVEAVDDGHSIDDVVGSDVPAFAAEWASVERRHPVVGLALQALGAPALLIGAVALVNPVLQLGGPQGQIGVPVTYVGLATLVALLGVGWQAIRIRRHRLSAKRASVSPRGCITCDETSDVGDARRVAPSRGRRTTLPGTHTKEFELAPDVRVNDGSPPPSRRSPRTWPPGPSPTPPGCSASAAPPSTALWHAARSPPSASAAGSSSPPPSSTASSAGPTTPPRASAMRRLSLDPAPLSATRTGLELCCGQRYGWWRATDACGTVHTAREEG